MRTRLTLALLACSLVPGCFSLDDDGDGLIDIPPRSGEERDEISCSDGRDNDYDGRIDCQDTDCLMRGFCGEQIPHVPHYMPENTPETCTDGIDNDEDGQFDCGDRECQSIMELCCNAETNNFSCSNRLDDDGNGFADCTDFSCRNNAFVSVCQSETACIRLDSSGNLVPPGAVAADGTRRCTNDPRADPGPENEVALAQIQQCSDRFDNDGDRRTDCNDPDCSCTEVCYPGCAGPENTVARCLDGEDNDGNGFADCADRACFDARSTPPTGVAATECAARVENTQDRCTDGIDNDGNGYTDSRDRNCSAFCGGGQPEAGLAACTDGIDNDGNGFVDCDDNSCRYAPELAIREACEATPASCSDKRDNNGNGFTDCADFSCRFYQCDANPTGCTRDEECPSGQSCFDRHCLRVTSPCLEGAYLGADFTEIPGGCPMRTPPTDPAELAAFLEALLRAQQAQVRAGCTDGIDNDLDGFVDCDDWDCNHNPLAVTVDGLPLCRGGDGLPLVCR